MGCRTKCKMHNKRAGRLGCAAHCDAWADGLCQRSVRLWLLLRSLRPRQALQHPKVPLPQPGFQPHSCTC